MWWVSIDSRKIPDVNIGHVSKRVSHAPRLTRWLEAENWLWQLCNYLVQIVASVLQKFETTFYVMIGRRDPVTITQQVRPSSTSSTSSCIHLFNHGTLDVMWNSSALSMFG